MKIVELGSYIKQVRGVSYSSGDSIKENKPGYLPVLRSNNIEESNLNFDDLVYVPKKFVKEYQLLKKGDILITASTGSIKVIGKNGYVKEDYNGSFGAFCKVVRPLREIDSKYLKHFFQSKNYRRYIKNIVNGANINNIKNGHIDELKIPLPPLNTQKKIAAILDAADKLCQLDKKLIEKYDALTQSLFLDMFGDVRINENQFKEETIQQACILVTDGAHRTPKLLDEGYPFLTVANMSETGYLFENCKRISEVDYKDLIRNNCQPLKDDILFSKDGTVGKVMRIRKFEEVVILSSIALLRFKKDYNPIYVEHYLKTDFFLFQATSRKSGSAIRRIVLKDLKKTKIALPPMELQNQFAERLKAIDAQKAQAQQSLQKSQELFNSLLQKAFKGELV